MAPVYLNRQTPTPVTEINLVDETSELMVISQFGKIIRIDTKSIRAAGRSTMGVKLLDLDSQGKVAAAVVISPKKPRSNSKKEHYCSSHRCCSCCHPLKGDLRLDCLRARLQPCRNDLISPHV